MIPRNPVTVHRPLSDYTHQIEIGAPGRWLVLSGQVGMTLDGTVPDDPVVQIEVALGNITRNLEVAGMGVRHVVKLTIYLVGEIEMSRRRAVVGSWLAGHLPCMTLLYVAGLGTPQLKVEVDAWAYQG